MLIRIGILACFLCISATLFSQGRIADEEFGKNRVQYHDDFSNWWRYEADNVIVFWYGKARNIAEGAFQIAEYDYPEIQAALQHRINERIEVIVYTDITDLKQSNIGSTELFEVQTGETKIVENKVFVYFNGSHSDLRRQIREGLARVFIDQMVFGSNFQEMIQSALAVDFPFWFKEGLVAHVGEMFNYEDDSRFRDKFLNQEPEEIEDLIDWDPRITGKAFWHYLTLHYGRATIANILYLTRINRNLENGFRFVIGKSFDQVKREFFEYYQSNYEEESKRFTGGVSHREVRGFINRHDAEIIDIAISPDGSRVVYVENEIGRNRVFLHDLNTGDRSLLFREGFRNPFQDPDYNYPNVRWHPDGDKLMILYERRDVIYFREYDLSADEYQEQEINPIYQRVYSIDYFDERTLVLAATTDGFSDLYLYDLPTRQSTRLTRDIYDHKWVAAFEKDGERGILFSSNRQTTSLERKRRDSILPFDPFNLFYLDISGEADSAVQLIESASSDETLVRHSGGDHFHFLSNYNGVNNIYRKALPGAVEEDENYPVPVSGRALTSMPANISTFDYRNGTLIFTKIQGGTPTLFRAESQAVQTISPNPTILRTKLHGDISIELEPVPSKQFDPERISDGQRFQSRFEDPAQMPFTKEEPFVLQRGDQRRMVSKSLASVDKEVKRFRSARAIASRLHFRFEEVSTSLDNSLLFSGLDAYSGIQEGFDVPPVGILIRTRAFDIFEDYIFEGGVRIPTSFNGSEFYLIFDDNKRRWNRRYAVYRRSRTEREPARFGSFDQEKNTTHIFQNRWTYPFDIFRSVRFTGTLRLDRFISQSTSTESLERPDFNRQSFGLRAEYVFDNTYDVLINIKNGTRYKFYVEGVNQFRVQFSPWEFDASSGFMTVIGFDARHYERILKHSIIALRGAGATSLGSERILFYMGGVENWFSPGFNQNIPIPQDEKFAYQAMALNMRGFDQNIRNGTSYLVLNTELRVPLFHYFSRTPPRSNLLNSFQLVGFFDLGYTWYGSDPFDGDNPLNSATISNPVSTIEVEYFRDPAVMGFGFGFRAKLFGYFFRVDRGWGVETRQIQDPKWHISMGFDF
ncbi:MAG: hypothetical protein EA411_05985 [Saprospirales bacterium]|nr:MAG: hypothetical protein EA411_05985 [Saprospirales bacterium]